MKIKFVRLRDASTWNPRILLRISEGKKCYLTHGPDLVECPPCKGGSFRFWMNEEEKEEFLKVWKSYTEVLYHPEMVKARRMMKAHDREMVRLGEILTHKLREELGWRACLDEVNRLKAKFKE